MRFVVVLQLLLPALIGFTGPLPGGAQQANPNRLRANLTMWQERELDWALEESNNPLAYETRREKFEAEFGVGETGASPIRAGVQSAKYGVDLLVFSITDALESLKDRLELEYSHGTVRRPAQPADPFKASSTAIAPFAARLKFDFELWQGGPYVGMRLVIPLGK